MKHLREELKEELERAGLDPQTPPSPAAWQAFLRGVNARLGGEETSEKADDALLWLEEASDQACVTFATQHSEARFHAIFEAASVGIVLTTTDHLVFMANRALTRLLGIDERALKQYDFSTLLLAEDQVRYRRLMEDLQSGTVSTASAEFHLLPPERAPVPTSITGSVIRDGNGAAHTVVAIIEDLTERKRLEAELRLAHKLEAVGKMAAGLAHEINTPLQYISDSVSFFQDGWGQTLGLYRATREKALAGDPAWQAELTELEIDADLEFCEEQVPRSVKIAQNGLKTIAEIVHALKVFAHGDSASPYPVDINRELQTTLRVTERALSAVADIQMELGRVPDVTCRPAHLNQVFMNVLLNAAYSVEEVMKRTGQKGKIRIVSSVKDGEVVLEFTDSGTGIPEDIRHRIFDPFFTTHQVGQGAGLGLTVARAVVEQHGGKIDVVTEVGRGSTFLVKLPV